MQQCGQCGNNMPDNTTTCPVCGSAIASQPGSGAVHPSAEVQPKKKKPFKIIAIVVIVLLVLGLFSQCSNGCKGDDSKYDWPTGPLAQMIPSMNVKCEFVNENDDSVSIRVSKDMNKQKYDAYVAECKERGFTVDEQADSSSYAAYNVDGYELSLTLWSDGDSMSIDLSAPKTDGSLVWPNYGLATLLPNPNKDKGSVGIDSSSQFTAFVGNMSQEEYGSYVDKCMEYGFNVGHSKGDKMFSAKDAVGNSLQLTYEGFNTMSISMYAAKKVDDSASEKATPSESAPPTESSEPVPEQSVEQTGSDYKSMMDDYEKYMDSYIAFMVKYQNSGQAASMALDYAKMLKDYADWATKIDAVDESALTEEEAAYGVEVVTRVNQKLADAGVALSA